MATGYNFRGKSTRDVRQYVNMNQVFDQKGANMNGKNVVINVAQDDAAPEDAQTDTRLNRNIYDQELYKSSDQQKGVDATVGLSPKQWDKLVEGGEIVEHDGTEYLTYQSDVMLKDDAIPNTNTVKPMEQPFDKAKHDELTQGARTAKKEAAADAGEVEKEVEDELEP